MTRREIIQAANQIAGWMSEQELAWLIDTASSLPPEARWFELGTHIGRSFLAVALALPPRSVLHVVDHILGERQTADGQTFFQVFERAVRARPDLNFDCQRLPTTSAALVYGQAQVKAEVVFIDASHDYEAVRQDILCWQPIVRQGGMLCGHDYNPDVFPGVVRAVDELLPHRDRPAGSIWAATVGE